MNARPALILLIFGVYTTGLPDRSSVFADTFDDHSVYWLKQAVKQQKSLESLSMKDGQKLKTIGKGMTSPCIVVKTGEDNWAKALVSWGFRKSAAGRIPVVIIERFVNHRGDRPNLTTSDGEDVMLFPGFEFDFEIGQVVPQGHGGDIALGEPGTLTPVGPAELYGLNGPAVPIPEPSKYPDPNSHTGVLPTDFAGAWKVRIDGRWEGRWDLDVDGRQVFGRFISGETKSVYEVHGRVTALQHNAKFDVELANTDQSFDAYLWTKDKSAMAGTVTMAGRKLGFFATRIRQQAGEKSQ